MLQYMKLKKKNKEPSICLYFELYVVVVHNLLYSLHVFTYELSISINMYKSNISNNNNEKKKKSGSTIKKKNNTKNGKKY